MWVLRGFWEGREERLGGGFEEFLPGLPLDL